MRYLITILIAFVLMVTYSCADTCSIGAKTKILTGRKWKMNSYVDYSVNREMYIATEKYEFYTDGTLLKIKDSDTICEKWEFPECGYLRIDSKTFKIAELSRKIMILRYGETDFIYRVQR